MSDLLQRFHEKLREAGIEPPEASVVPPAEEAPEESSEPVEQTPQGPADTTATPTPLPGLPDGGDQLASPEPTRFPSNPHRFRWMQGDPVCWFDEQGVKQEGTIAAPPAGDQYQVVGAGGAQSTVLKSELFLSPSYVDPALLDPAQQGTDEPDSSPSPQ